MDQILLCLCFLLAVRAVIVIRRLYFHPLSAYPGTKLGIASPTLYKLYRNFKRRGQFIFEIEQLHQKHGPIVRSGINDLHINDPSIYLQITKIGSRFRKDPKFYDRISFRNTSLGFLDPYQHRARHSILVNAAFSPTPKNIQHLARLVEQKVTKLCDRFDTWAVEGIPVNIHKGMKALSMDVISELTMGRSFGCLDHPTFSNVFLEQLHSIFQEMTWMQKILFTVAKVSLSTPPWMFRFVHPPTMVMMKELAKPLIRDYVDSRKGEVSNEQSLQKAVIIDALTSPSGSKNTKPLDFETLSEEVVTLLTAGGDTVSSALIYGIYHICRNEQVHRKLVEELLTAFPATDDVSYQGAHSLPYLNACIKEILRTGNPLPGRLPRVVPQEGFDLYGRHIPGGCVFNTSAYLLNRHPSIWDRPDDFDPDRWLKSNSGLLEQYMASFYRGTRQCLGKDLAWCELYVMLARLFRQFHVVIHDTSDADMEWIDAVLIVFKGKNLKAMLSRRDT
ncbi:cytochrome P450 [Paraphaeosphaeria sporulosa]|uniref:Cytochrome P450 n=1 Tax=Paraphaeosphaeria sporulosa TaxID=1460663 RepID=A0A177CV71_9PLEO|nr:cytochrome P450 [Paraphaeosphaeria sporulosa]OAG11454.1 cytochrome P450 [Paraphaeosphaeria sporulosa]